MEDYKLVLNAYKQYKDVGLAGSEVSVHMRAIKFMFTSNHTPKEIIDCIKWMANHENDEETRWVKMWTIWTVRKKIAEFKAGKLGNKQTVELYPRYSDMKK